jgi:hypothetical protein
LNLIDDFTGSISTNHNLQQAYMQLSRENACAGFDLKAGLAGLSNAIDQAWEAFENLPGHQQDKCPAINVFSFQVYPVKSFERRWTPLPAQCLTP